MTSKKRVSVEELRALMDSRSNIRNFSVIAHVDHGKSTLTDSLLASNEIIAKKDAGTKRGTDTREDEQLRCITIKSTGVTLLFEAEDKPHIQLPPSAKGGRFLINLIDSPGHVDFSSEVTAALRLTDGALVVVDCVEGCCVQTETVLRQALQERIKPVLTINKLDRAFLELQFQPEDMYQAFARCIQSVNTVIGTYQDGVLGDLKVYPEKGSVAFSAGKQCWAFTLLDFARFYEKKLNVKADKLVPRLWGDNYFDHEAKKWRDVPVSPTGQLLKRGFCEFIIEPISKIFVSCVNDDMPALEKSLVSLNIKLTTEEREQKSKELLKTVMQKWLPAADALLEMVVKHLPSPVEAQRYRVDTLYQGPLDDETAEAIRNCDPNGPLVMFVAKLVPNKDNSRFFAFGRVFSGTASSQKVRIMGNNFQPGSKVDLFVNKPIQRVVLMMGGRTDPIDSVPCGNTCGLVGIDTFLSKSGTITTSDTAFPLVNMKFNVSPVVRVAVAAKNPSDIGKFSEALKKLNKSEPMIVISVEPTGEHVIACAGELQMEICLHDLQGFMGDSEITTGPPVVSLRETVSTPSDRLCLSKSPNHHNRLYAQAQPLDNEVTQAIESGQLSAKDDPKAFATKLVKDYGWDQTDAKKIWTFGPERTGANLLIDGTKGVQYMSEIKDSVVSAFQVITKCGVLADEELRGVRFSLMDATLHSDSIHRGGGQLLPAARRVLQGAQLTANPRLVEPVFLVEIQCPESALSGVFNVLNQRRGVIFDHTQHAGTPLYNMKGYLPVLESFGFTEALRADTSGQAFPQMVFDHWAVIEEDPFVASGRASNLIAAIRKRKGIEPSIPPLDRFVDKL